MKKKKIIQIHISNHNVQLIETIYCLIQLFNSGFLDHIANACLGVIIRLLAALFSPFLLDTVATNLTKMCKYPYMGPRIQPKCSHLWAPRYLTILIIKQYKFYGVHVHPFLEDSAQTPGLISIQLFISITSIFCHFDSLWFSVLFGYTSYLLCVLPLCAQ